MISFVLPLAIGNAVRLILQEPQEAKLWRVLRRQDASFAGADDPDAVLVHEGTQCSVLDYTGLANGSTVFYADYWWDGSAWNAGNVQQVTPGFSLDDQSVDPFSIVRDRIELGLQHYVDTGVLSNSLGRIPVMTASPLFEETPLPVVTVHLANDDSVGRVVGDAVDIAFPFDIPESEGWLSRWQITVVGWSLNADERIALRQAIKAVLMGNLPVFDAAGMVQIDMQFSDTEDYQSYNAPVYMTSCYLSCFAPSVVRGTNYQTIDSVIATPRSLP